MDVYPSPDAPMTSSEWWATLHPEVQRAWVAHVTGWTLDRVREAAWVFAHGVSDEPRETVGYQDL